MCEIHQKKCSLWRVQNPELLEKNRAVSHYNQMFGVCFLKYTNSVNIVILKKKIQNTI